jgi:biotin synthase
VGIGPFLPAKNTPFEAEKAGSSELTLFLLSAIRLMLPEVLLPATTALGTARSDGRLQGLMHGANVIMPNISPDDVRKKYLLYDNKFNGGLKENILDSPLRKQMQKIGYDIVIDRGDHCV